MTYTLSPADLQAPGEFFTAVRISEKDREMIVQEAHRRLQEREPFGEHEDRQVYEDARVELLETEQYLVIQVSDEYDAGHRMDESTGAWSANRGPVAAHLVQIPDEALEVRIEAWQDPEGAWQGILWDRTSCDPEDGEWGEQMVRWRGDQLADAVRLLARFGFEVSGFTRREIGGTQEYFATAVRGEQMVQLCRTKNGLDRAQEQAQVFRAERDQQVRQLISQGQSMYSIAKVLGVTAPSVRQIRDAG